jgi:hypothetical protein
MGFGWNFGLLPHGTLWRQHSRALHKHLGSTDALYKYHPVMNEETKAFLRKVNSHPNDIFEDIMQYATHIFTG